MLESQNVPFVVYPGSHLLFCGLEHNYAAISTFIATMIMCMHVACMHVDLLIDTNYK